MDTQRLRFWRFGLRWGLTLLLVACGAPTAEPVATTTPTITLTSMPTNTPVPTATAPTSSRTDSPVTSNQWTRKAAMPTARTGPSAAVIDGKIYVVGGETADGNPDLTKVSKATGALEVYDPVTDAWVGKAAMPTARSVLATAVVQGKLYAIGGYLPTLQQTPIVEAYDPQSDTWRRRADLPTPRNGLAAVVVDDKIYALGGYYNGWLSTVEVYDPSTDTWTKKTDMPTPRSDFVASVLNGEIYVLGGGAWDEKSVSFAALATVAAYNPVTDQWTAKRAMPTARAGLTGGVINQRIYAVAGAIPIDMQTTQLLATVEWYDPLTEQWAPGVDLSQPRFLLTAAVVNDKLYVIGGALGETFKPLATVEEFTPGSE